MSALVYALCALSACACAVLLLRAYLRNRVRLLFWSGVCFVCLTLNNLLLVLDRVIYPEIDFFLWRNLAVLFGLLALLYGFIWEGR